MKQKSEWYLSYVLYKQDKNEYLKLINKIKSQEDHQFQKEAAEISNK